MGGVSLPIQLEGVGEHRELPIKNEFGAFYFSQNPSFGRKIQSVY